MKKGCLLAAVGGLVLVAAIIGFVFWLTSGAVEAGDSFLALLGQGKTEAAYQTAASQFKAETDLETFKSVVEQLGLNHYASSSWSSRNVQNNQASLEGSIATTDGGTVPLNMSLVKEEGKWKVLAFSGPKAGASTTNTGNPVPSDDDAARMTKKALADFRTAISTGDFASFHGTISNLWKSQASPESLRQAFQSLLGRQADFAAVDGEPTFSHAPSLDKDHILHLDGYFAQAGSPRVNFELQYIYEHPNWKLFGIHVSLSKVDSE